MFVRTKIAVPDIVKTAYACFGNVIYHSTHGSAASVECSIDNRYVECFLTVNRGAYCFIVLFGTK